MRAHSISKRSLLFAALLSAAAAILASSVIASEDEERVLTGTVTGEQVVAGESVRVYDATLADLFVAGGEISADQVTAEDVIAAGGSLRLKRITAKDLIAAGGEIELDGELSEDLIAAGGQIELGPEARVSGYALLAGGNIELEGHIEGNVKAAAGRLRVSGEIGGNLDVVAGELSIEPGARIAGKLTYRSGDEAKIAPDAVIEGGIERHMIDHPKPSLGAIIGALLAFAAIVVLGLAILGAVLHAAMPEILANAAAMMRWRFWSTFGIGIALLIATPVVTNLIFFTVIGIPFAVFLFLIYAALLLPAIVTAAFWLGESLARAFGWSRCGEPLRWRMLWTLLGLLLLLLVALIPLLGILLILAALALGLGGLVLQLKDTLAPRMRRPHGHSPAVSELNQG